MADDERVLVWRIHHALADGASAIRCSRALLWDDAPEQAITQLCLGFCADSDLVPNVQTLAAQVEPESQALIGALRHV